MAALMDARRRTASEFPAAERRAANAAYGEWLRGETSWTFQPTPRRLLRAFAAELARREFEALPSTPGEIEALWADFYQREVLT